jgi:hypothetical protein
MCYIINVFYFAVELVNYIVIHTTPNTLDVYEPSNHTHGIFFKQNNCYLTERKGNTVVSIDPCDVSSHLFNTQSIFI